VRKEITKKTRTLRDFGLSDEKPTIFAFGGSRGARKINETLKITAQLLPEFQFIWQTGESMEPLDYPNVWMSKFVDDMGSAYGNAELVISRAGALTIGELAAVGLPSILIPYPHATGRHQEMNARMLEKDGATIMIMERDLTPSVLAEQIKKIIGDKKLQMTMKSAIRSFGTKDTAGLIAERMIEICGKDRKRISRPGMQMPKIQNP
jgi:UDP-N-acetylglucosamine--N-acetylmuramyl-(pentapeptide) pyrophosphoryl-undecaprenol N-acetylglucosamine transferase